MAEVQDLVTEEVGEVEAEEQKIEQATATSAAPQAQAQDDDIPEEFKGLSPKELANMVKHARHQMGKQANELGEVRRLADELIKSTLKPKETAAEQPKEVDFFENPQEAIRRAVETNPAVLQAQQYALRAQQEQARMRLQQKHPDWQQVMGDPEFASWVQKSPVRVKLLQQANAYDVDAADEVFSTYKELKAVRKPQVSEAEKAARSQTMKAAAVDSGGSGESSKKIYRRVDLMNMQIRDRAKYEALQDEIMQAYREGRVR